MLLLKQPAGSVSHLVWLADSPFINKIVLARESSVHPTRGPAAEAPQPRRCVRPGRREGVGEKTWLSL